MLLFAACRQPLSVGTGVDAVTVGVAVGASVEVSFVIPDFTSGADGGIRASRAIAPQTAMAALLLNNDEHSVTVGTLTTDRWTGTFPGVPAAAYPAGTMTIELRDAARTPLTRGSNYSPVTVVTGQTTTGVQIRAVPVNAPLLPRFSVESGSVPSSAMTYYSLAVAESGHHRAWVMRPSHRGVVAVFDPNGRLLGSAEFWPGDWRDLGFNASTPGTYYVGVYGAYGYGQMDVAFDLLVADRTPTLAVAYGRTPPRWYRVFEQIGDGAVIDLGSFDRGYPASWNGNQLTFMLYNFGAGGAVRLTEAAPDFVSLEPDTGALVTGQQPSEPEVRQWIEFSLALDTDALVEDGTAVLTIPYRLELDGTDTPGTFMATLQYHVVEPQPLIEIHARNRDTDAWTIVPDGGIWNAGMVYRDSSASLQLNIHNPGRGRLSGELLIGVDPSGQVTNSGSHSFDISAGSARTLWVDVQAGAAADTFEVPITVTSNALISSRAFTLRFEVADYTGYPQVELRSSGYGGSPISSGVTVDLGPYFRNSGTWSWWQQLRNVGTNVLHILSASVSGGQGALTVPGHSDAPILPDSWGWVHVQLETSGSAGECTESLTISSDDPASPHVVHHRYLLADEGDIVARFRSGTYAGRTMPSDSEYIHDASRFMERAWTGYTDRYYLQLDNRTDDDIELSEVVGVQYLALAGSGAFAYGGLYDRDLNLADAGVVPARDRVYLALDFDAATSGWHEATASFIHDGEPYVVKMKQRAESEVSGVTGTVTHPGHATWSVVTVWIDDDDDLGNGFWQRWRLNLLTSAEPYRIQIYEPGTWYLHFHADSNNNGVVDAGEYYAIREVVISPWTVTTEVDVTLLEDP